MSSRPRENSGLAKAITEVMGDKQPGFSHYEKITAKKSHQEGEVLGRNGSGCAIAAPT